MNFKEDLESFSTKENRQILGIDEIDPIEFSDKYFNTKSLGNLSIDPNANVTGISPNNYLSEIAKPSAKKYFFRKLFEKGKALQPEYSLKHVYDGTIYIHDATKLQPYCFGVSATEIATLGRPYATLIAKPPKRLGSFMGQLTEFVMDCSQEFAGAVAVTDLVPWMAWFIEKGKDEEWFPDWPSQFRDIMDHVDAGFVEDTDGLMFCPGGRHTWHKHSEYTDKEIENVFQSFVHVLNNSFRVGGDSPFTNISINSKMVYYDMFEHYIFPDGKTIDDLWKTIKRVQKIIIDFMGKGRPDGLPYKFPILTANFKAKEEEMESEWFKYVAEKNYKGFMNVNFAARFAMCCRLSLDFDFKQNSFGGGGVKVGSMRVANLNLPRIAYEAKDRSVKDRENIIITFFKLLEEYIDESILHLTAYHDVFISLIDAGYLKFFKEPSLWFSSNMFFATVGFCGISDTVDIIGYDHVSYAGYNLMKEIIDVFVMKTKNDSNGIKFNVEEVPSESAAGKMAKFNKDYGETREYYSNQFVQLSKDIPLHRRIEIESKLQSALTGGGMTFLNFDSEITPKQSYDIHKYMMDEGFQGQFCINYGYSYCPSCKTTVIGKIDKCKECGTVPEFYTRVVGYLAKTTDTADSKVAEIDDRFQYKDV